MLRTSNGGDTWTVVEVPTDPDLFAMYFIDEMTGWVAGSSKLNTSRSVIFKTTDAGTTWTTQLDVQFQGASSVFFLDLNQGWAGTGYALLKTTDGGFSWEELPDPRSRAAYSIYFRTSTEGWVATSSGRFLHTIDGGNSWTDTKCPSTLNLEDLAPTDSGGFVVVGGEAGILRYRGNSISSVSNDRMKLDGVDPSVLTSYPNPFNSATKISYQIRGHPQRVTLRVFDLLGREVGSLFDDFEASGVRVIQWNGRDSENSLLASGPYFLRLEIGGRWVVRRVLLLR